jgi:hypothetical protein
MLRTSTKHGLAKIEAIREGRDYRKSLGRANSEEVDEQDVAPEKH